VLIASLLVACATAAPGGKAAGPSEPAASATEPAAPNPAAPAGKPGGAAPEYRIGPGDQLNVFVFNQPDLSISVQVRPDGLISTPLVENMTAAGKTPSQLGRDIEKELAEYIRTPQVNIIVTGFVGNYGDQIRVVGQAAHPQALAYRNGMTLLDVMITVGGLGEFASGNRAHIVRRQGGKQLQIKVRLDDLINKGDISANIGMLPGDVLIIPQSRF